MLFLPFVCDGTEVKGGSKGVREAEVSDKYFMLKTGIYFFFKEKV